MNTRFEPKKVSDELDKPKERPKRQRKEPSKRRIKKTGDSTTKVNQDEGHGIGIWGGPRVVRSFRVDKYLWDAFVPWTQHVCGSICLPIECMAAALMGANVKVQESEVYQGSTVRPVRFDFGTVNILRNLRERRKLPADTGEEIEDHDVCDYPSCGEAAAFRDEGLEGLVWLCESHHERNVRAGVVNPRRSRRLGGEKS